MTMLHFGIPVHFEDGARRLLPRQLAEAGVTRPLFVTDKGVLAAGVFAQAIEALAQPDGVAVFSNVPPNPTEAAAAEGAAAYRSQGCDGIVGIGGGAALDLAKAIAVLATNAPPLWQYCNRHPEPSEILNPPPLILMPTTAGTGSEVGRSAVIIFDNGIKAGVRCPRIVTAAICDPELTLGLPPAITAATGMDALAHCIETYSSPAANPIADAIALDGMTRIFAHIQTAYRDGANRAARWNMLMGSVEGAICFQKGMGAVHALSHPLGALGHHHGTLNAILLPEVLRVNLEALGPKADAMAKAAGLSSGDQLPQAMRELVASLGLPTQLRVLGVEQNQLPGVAAAALQDNAHKTNPRPMTQDDYLQVLTASF